MVMFHRSLPVVPRRTSPSGPCPDAVAMTAPSRRPPGFTLTELLVVIAIIAVLAMLLLPAIQNVRQSAMATHCSNNLRQLTLGCLTFHDAKNRFPPAGATDGEPFGTSTGTNPNVNGSTWAVYLLPYIEQQPLFDKWDFKNQDSGWLNVNNRNLRTPFIDAFVCPASSLPAYCSAPPNAANPRQDNSYVAIVGAGRNFPAGSGTYSGDRKNTSYGTVANDGVLTYWGKNRMKDIGDGTSATMILGEWSDVLTTTSGTTIDPRGLNGFAIGPRGTPTTTFTTWTADTRAFNSTSIRYRINLDSGWTGSGATGVCSNFCANHPLTSAHAGGVNAGFADGSVRFLTDATDIDVLSSLAVRSDASLLRLD